MSGAAVAAAIAAFTPIVRALVLEAEQTGRSGEEKHAAVSDAAEQIYKTLQNHGGIKEIRDVPWDLVGPVVIPVTGGLIAIIVGLFNKIFGRVWDFIADFGDDDE
tara:strand:- start:502 stop:816 length:315 start_codon:yes stop_codon:yes gene_type:complete